MPVLVTGATGFVGAHVTRALVERGDSVRAGYRNPKRLGRLGDLEVEPVEGEVLDLDAMRTAMRGCDTVFHVAGFVASKPVGEGLGAQPARPARRRRGGRDGGRRARRR